MENVKVGWCGNDGHNGNKGCGGVSEGWNICGKHSLKKVKVGWCWNDGHNGNKGCGGGSEGWNICGEHSLVYLI